jgi:sulfite exporter TauE/SafE
MGLGTSIFLIAVGAIMRFAVNASTSGFSIHTAGTIIMVVGVVGLLISLLWMTVWADRRRAVPADDEYAGRRQVVREREVL